MRWAAGIFACAMAGAFFLASPAEAEWGAKGEADVPFGECVRQLFAQIIDEGYESYLIHFGENLVVRIDIGERGTLELICNRETGIQTAIYRRTYIVDSEDF